MIALVLLAFAGLTLFFSSSVLFDLFEIRAQKGNYVPFIVQANFICGLLYIPAAFGLLFKKKWSFIILSIASLILIVAFFALRIHVNSGGLYEMETVNAMTFRTTLTVIFALSAFLLLRSKSNN
jgi:hypothetical protein